MARFLDKLSETVLHGGDRVACISAEGSCTLRAVDELANRIARWLQENLPTQLAVVGVAATVTLDIPALILAVFKANKVFLGIDPAYPPARLAQMVSDSGCRLVVVNGPLTFRVASGVRVIHTADLLRQCQQFGGAKLPPATLPSNAPAYITFTSGSTGRPKPVAAPVEQVDNRLEWMWSRYPFGPDDVSCHRMPLSFIDTVWEVLGPICGGSPLVLLPASETPLGYALIEALRRYEITRLWILPAALNHLLVQYDLATATPAMRWWVSTGDAIHPGVIRRFFSRMPEGRLFNLYGTSEVWDATWGELSGDRSDDLFAPIGDPISNVETYLIDTDGIGEIQDGFGEIAVAGLGVGLGYLRPGGSIESFLKRVSVDGQRSTMCFPTGDYGLRRGGGPISFTGRRSSWKGPVGSGVSLLAIEAAASLHPRVAECAVSIVKNQVSAYFQPIPEADLTTAELMAHLREILDEGNLPDHCIKVGAFPMTPSGKIARKALGS